MEDKVQFHRGLYRELLDARGRVPQGLGHGSLRSYYRTKGAVVEHVDFEGATVLDLGCGFGDMLPFVLSGRAREYVGVDLMPDCIDEARKRYGEVEEARFLCEDVFKFADGQSGAYDIVLTLGLATYADREWFDRLLEVSYRLARRLAIVTVTSSFATGDKKIPLRDREVFNLHPAEAVAAVTTLTTKFALRHDFYRTSMMLFLYK